MHNAQFDLYRSAEHCHYGVMKSHHRYSLSSCKGIPINAPAIPLSPGIPQAKGHINAISGLPAPAAMCSSKYLDQASATLLTQLIRQTDDVLNNTLSLLHKTSHMDWNGAASEHMRNKTRQSMQLLQSIQSQAHTARTQCLLAVGI